MKTIRIMSLYAACVALWIYIGSWLCPKDSVFNIPSIGFTAGHIVFGMIVGSTMATIILISILTIRNLE